MSGLTNSPPIPSNVAAVAGYISGVYTPVLTGPGGTPPTYTGTPPTGGYVRVGNLVFVTVAMSNAAGGVAGVGPAQLILSLPFPVSAGMFPTRLIIGSYRNSGTERSILGAVSPGTTTLFLYRDQVNGSNADQVIFTCADQNGADRAIVAQFYYPTDAP